MKQTKGILLAAFFAVAAFAGGAVGYNQYQVTRFGDLRCTDILLDGNDILDSGGTTRITVGATQTYTATTHAFVGNMTLTGSLTPTGTSYFTLQQSTAPRDTSSTIGVTPTSLAQLVFNSTDKELCMSTGTTRFTWVKVSTPSAACAH